MSELETPFNKLSDYFNREKFNFKCHIIFGKKNYENNKTFFADVYETKHNEDNIFLMYLYISCLIYYLNKLIFKNIFIILY